jgi:integrase
VSRPDRGRGGIGGSNPLFTIVKAFFAYTMALPKSFQNFTDSIMRFSAKAVLADHVKRDGTRALYVQAIINRMKANVNLGFAIDSKYFDGDKGVMKVNTPNCELINFQIADAVLKANKIFLDYKYSERLLTPENFKKEFTDPSSIIDLISFMEKEIELRKPKLSQETYGSNVTILNKLKAFKKRILFHELTVDLLQKLENQLIKDGLGGNTIHKVFRTIKVYIHLAEKKEIKFKNPFKEYHVKQVAPNKPTLSFDEIKTLFGYYRTSQNESHIKLLRYFLFSCITGIRISDIGILEWNHLHGRTLVFLPYKTRKRNKFITMPLSDLHMNMIGAKGESKFLFETFAKAVANRMLKDIAKLDEVKINKHLTYHISRHTFATQFLNKGGQLDTLQQLLGHSMITTTMQYVQVNEGRKLSEVTNAFHELGE